MAIAKAHENKFIIPLDFEMLDCMIFYYQLELGNRLCYKIKFNDYGRVIVSMEASLDTNYKISDISLEYEIVTHPDLARHVSIDYQNMALLYDRVLIHRQIGVNKSDKIWNWSFNVPCKSLKGILVLFEEGHSYQRDTSKFYNPKIEKVPVIVKGKHNNQYGQGMRLFEQYDEVYKFFAKGKQKDTNTN